MQTPRLIALLTLAGFGLRLVLLDRFPLREDEAVYGYWALHAWLEDLNFLTVWPDKPPLFLWALAAALRAFGTDAAGARLLNIGLSTLTIPVVAATARQLWGTRSALFGALAMALSPFAISFAPTVFTDPMLVLAGSLALLLALRGQSFWAGLWLGVAIMTKQQAMLYVPLIGGALLLTSRISARPLGFAALHFLAGLLLIVLPLLYWDSLRWAVAPSPWDLGVRNYGALALASPALWPARLAAWLPLLWELTASWTVWLGLGLLWLIGYMGGHATTPVTPRRVAMIAGRPAHQLASTMPALGARRPIPAWALPQPWTWILLWSAGFIVLHVVTTVAIWDRYLLPLTPILALLTAKLLDAALGHRARREQALIMLTALLLLFPPAWNAAQGGRPVGGDHGAYAGYDQALAWLDQEMTATGASRAVLYHQSLGWHHQFYLYDQLRSGQYELRWFPSTVYLADNAAKTPARSLYTIQPEWARARDLDAHLRMRGVTLAPRFRAGTMTVYELQRAPEPYCTWCLSRPATIDN